MKKKALIFLITILSSNIHILAQSETDWILRLFNFSADVTSISDNAISLAVDAVWLASDLAGGEVTTGTLTQNGQGYWNYTIAPSDKLILIFSDGSRIEFKFNNINGFVGGDEEDFKNSHQMDFVTYIQNYINIRIVSNTTPIAGKIYWWRTISGNIISDGDNQSVNVQHDGQKESEIISGFAFQTVDESVIGSSSSAAASYSINDRFHVAIGHITEYSLYSKDTQFWKNSSITIEGTSYALQDMNVFYIGGTTLYNDAENGIYNQVVNDYLWSSEGTLLKNNQSYGNIIFSEPPANSTYGPLLIADLNSGGEIILHYLLNSVPTHISDKSTGIITEYHLSQNFPNPFNPSTTIRYQIPNDVSGEKQEVRLAVYDILGREVTTLVNKQQQYGIYAVEWNAVNEPSGIYFYRLTVGNFSETKKMILQK